MSSLSRKLTMGSAACGLALLALTAHASAAVITAFERRRVKAKASSGDLDRRTLVDIGIEPGTILWAVHGLGFDRPRRSPFEPAE
jgi:hypothetical protein